MNTKRVSLSLTVDQYNLARRRLIVENLTWQKVLRALVNAYIMGDITVTDQGRYTIRPPSSLVPTVQVPKEGDLIELDLDWGTPGSRPQVGIDDHRQGPRSKPEWGTKELASYLREVTGRRVRTQGLRLLLRHLGIPKTNGSRWSFKGEDDPHVSTVTEAIHSGLYDLLVREGLDELAARSELARKQEKELKEAKTKTEKQRRVAHLQRLRSLSSIEKSQ